MSKALTRCPVCGREMARPGRYKLQLFREEVMAEDERRGRCTW